MYAGGINLGCGLDWIVDLWIAQEVVRKIQVGFSVHDDKRLMQCLDAVWNSPDRVANLTDATTEEISRLRDAANTALAETEVDGAKDWFQPSTFPSYLANFQELVRVIAADPRAR